MEPVQVTAIVFFTRDRKLLLQDRRGYSTFGEEWSFFGGHVEPGESPDEAVVRETKEELDYNLEHHTYFGHMLHKHEDDHVAEVHYYIKEIEHLDDFTVKEGATMKLFTIDEAKKLKMLPGFLDALKMLEENL